MTNTLLFLFLTGCPGKEDTGTTPGGHDADDTDTAGESGSDDCFVTLLGATPEDGDTGVYYREVLQVSFQDGDRDQVTLTLVDADGTEVAIDEVEWSEGDLQASLHVVLAPSTTYTLTASACETTLETTFTTSDLGTSMTVAPEDLIGRTFMFRLSDAYINEPVFLNSLAGAYLTTPLLFHVTAASDSSIDLLGALGYHESDGSYSQVGEQPTWDFPAGDFGEAPYFEAYAEQITITYGDIDIPVDGFTLAGTFTADGSSIEEGTASGLGDSRYMGELVGQEGVPGAFCEIAEEAGIYCTECADGEPYCMYIGAEDISAEYLSGVSVVPYP